MSNPRFSNVVVSQVAMTTQVDMVEVTPADDKPLGLYELVIGQSTDFGDAQDEILTITVIRGFTSSGSGGSAPTPGMINPIDTAAGYTAETMNTTVANTGTSVKIWEDTFNVRAGYQHIWPAGLEPGVTQANTTLVIRISAPADSITLSGSATFGET